VIPNCRGQTTPRTRRKDGDIGSRKTETIQWLRHRTYPSMFKALQSICFSRNSISMVSITINVPPFSIRWLVNFQQRKPHVKVTSSNYLCPGISILLGLPQYSLEDCNGLPDKYNHRSLGITNGDRQLSQASQRKLEGFRRHVSYGGYKTRQFRLPISINFESIRAICTGCHTVTTTEFREIASYILIASVRAPAAGGRVDRGASPRNLCAARSRTYLAQLQGQCFRDAPHDLKRWRCAGN
jgi:hypothetical protein